jgi:hypothetical protein
MASRMAEEQKNAQGIVASELGIAKVFHDAHEQEHKPQEFSSADSMKDIGRKLLRSIGFASPDDVSIQAAIEANDAFIAKLEAIRDSAQGLTIDQTSVDGCQPKLASMKKRRRRLWSRLQSTPMMHLSSNWSALPRGIEFNGNALAIAQFKTPSSPAFRATANHRIDALN